MKHRRVPRGLPACDGREGRGARAIKVCRCPRCAILRYTALYRGNRNSDQMLGAVITRVFAENA